MKYLFILLASFALCLFCQAQQFYSLEPVSQTDLFRFGEWTRETKNAVIFADVCNVRIAPDSKAEVVGKLTIGTSVQVLEVSSTKHEQAGVKAPWVKIKTSSVTGYVWGGLLTNGSVKVADDKQLYWGLISITPGGGGWQDYKISVRLAENGAVVQKHDFSLEYAGRPDEGKLAVYNPPQLTGVQNMIIFATPSEACGVTSTQHYFLYASGRMVFVGSGHAMGDGGMLHSSLEYIFPYPKNEDDIFADYHYTPEKDHVKLIDNEGGYDDNCEWIETHKVKDFKWENGKLVKYCEQ